jgi:hypothetical protein
MPKGATGEDLPFAAHVGAIMGVETNAMQFYPMFPRPGRRCIRGFSSGGTV